jgi:hypothetical protein
MRLLRLGRKRQKMQALSFVVPEKVQFRYKLEGWDRDWQDVGNRRPAFYTNLSPCKYRFRVSACNNSGVWNEAGAFLDFLWPGLLPNHVVPVVVRDRVLAIASGRGLSQLRLRQLAREYGLRLEERIARDLHDTLLQSFHGVLLRFQAASNLLPSARPVNASPKQSNPSHPIAVAFRAMHTVAPRTPQFG